MTEKYALFGSVYNKQRWQRKQMKELPLTTEKSGGFLDFEVSRK